MFNAWTSTNSKFCKAFFGHPGRALLAAWVLERGQDPFYQEEATDALRPAGEAKSATQTAIKLFVHHGLLTEFPDGNRKYYTALDHPLWAAYRAIAEALGLRAAPTPDKPSESRIQ